MNIKGIKRYCKDDISLIENYDKAINSKERWDCHHRLETDLDVSQQYLKDHGLYYNRPASELIFLTCEEHTALHNKTEYRKQRIHNPEAEAKRQETNNKPEVKEKHHKNMKFGHNTPEAKENHRKATQKRNNNPEYRKKIKEINNRPETREKKSKAMKGNKQYLDHIWVTNGIERKCPHKSKLDYYLNLGWVIGMKLKGSD